MISAILRWRSTMASNEMSDCASVITSMKPVSSCGKKPFGMAI